jgi:hypothetical protein
MEEAWPSAPSPRSGRCPSCWCWSRGGLGLRDRGRAARPVSPARRGRAAGRLCGADGGSRGRRGRRNHALATGADRADCVRRGVPTLARDHHGDPPAGTGSRGGPGQPVPGAPGGERSRCQRPEPQGPAAVSWPSCRSSSPTAQPGPSQPRSRCRAWCTPPTAPSSTPAWAPPQGGSCGHGPPPPGRPTTGSGVIAAARTTAARWPRSGSWRRSGRRPG